MIIDTSAIIAILRREQDADHLRRAILGSYRKRMSAGSYIEAGLVIGGELGTTGLEVLRALIQNMRIEIVAVTAQQALAAQQGFLDYGKGRHPARLNLGDCFAYALAKTESAPLLSKGDDFTKTDISIVKT
jgi:ribonuclease VapC